VYQWIPWGAEDGDAKSIHSVKLDELLRVDNLRQPWFAHGIMNLDDSPGADDADVHSIRYRVS
jgi:hypothetical protein